MSFFAATVLVAALVAHAIAEARAYAHVGGVAETDGSPNLLWLTSCIVFVLFEAAAAIAVVLASPVGVMDAFALVAGLFLYVFGVRVRCLAIRCIGPHFGVPRGVGAKGVEMGGALAVVRHPSELGLLAMTAGIVLACRNPIVSAIAALVALQTALRIVREEGWFARHEPDAYAAYSSRVTRRIWPQIALWPRLVRLVFGSER